MCSTLQLSGKGLPGAETFSMNQYERLLEAKRIRVGSSTENQHLDQCHTIPINGFDETRHVFTWSPVAKNLLAS